MLGKRLAQIVLNLGLNKRQFAQKIGVHPSMVTRWIEGENVPTKRTLAQICATFAVSQRWLEKGEGTSFQKSDELLLNQRGSTLEKYILLQTQQQKLVENLVEELKIEKTANETREFPIFLKESVQGIPLMSVVAGAGSPNWVDEEKHMGYTHWPVKWLRSLPSPMNSLYTITVAGDSMEPTLRNNQVVVISIDIDVVKPPYTGDIYIIRTSEGLLAKRLHGGKNEIEIRSDNPNYPPLVYTTSDLKTKMIEVLAKVFHRGFSEKKVKL